MWKMLYCWKEDKNIMNKMKKIVGDGEIQRRQNKFIEFKVRENIELLPFLMKVFNGISRNAAKSFLSNRQVLVNMKLTSQHNMLLQPGMTVYVNRGKGQREYKNKFLKIVYEDKYIIVVEKASGLLTIGTNTEKERTVHAFLNDYVRQGDKHGRVYVVHRLDRDTSGLLVFAKDEKTKMKLQDNWSKIVKERKYVAVVSGEMEKDSGTVTSWLMENKMYVTYSSPLKNVGDKAVTHYKTIKRANGFSLMEFELETGRKNQIRVHMNDLKHPIVGDEKYGNGVNPIGRLALHAFKLSFYHPANNKLLEFETPYPVAFKNLLEK